MPTTIANQVHRVNAMFRVAYAVLKAQGNSVFGTATPIQRASVPEHTALQSFAAASRAIRRVGDVLLTSKDDKRRSPIQWIEDLFPMGGYPLTQMVVLSTESNSVTFSRDYSLPDCTFIELAYLGFMASRDLRSPPTEDVLGYTDETYLQALLDQPYLEVANVVQRIADQSSDVNHVVSYFVDVFGSAVARTLAVQSIYSYDLLHTHQPVHVEPLDSRLTSASFVQPLVPTK